MQAYLEWGLKGAETLAVQADVCVVVDIMSFSTCVDIATGCEAVVHPFHFKNHAAAAAHAHKLGAHLAGRRRDAAARYTLSPPTLTKLNAGDALVLPSPNGSTISAALSGKPTLAGCLRNAHAVANKAAEIAGGGIIAVIPAGERWPDGSLRPAIEDLVGAGAILSALDAKLSPEAEIAKGAFLHAESQLSALLHGSVSGQELIQMGFPQDVATAVMFNVSSAAPVLENGVYAAS